MSVEKSRLYNFVNDSAADIKISSTKVDQELDQDITALNQKVLIKSSAPSSPIDGQTWIDISEDPPVLKIYDQTNAGWKTLSVYADFGLNSAKTAPVAADSVLINDSEASDALKEVTITNFIKALPADTIDAITEIKSTIKSGADGTLVTGTKGTSGNLAMWNADGDAVDSTVPATQVPAVASIIKGWVRFDGTGATGAKTPTSSYNVTGVNKTGTGAYTITWDTDFADATYCIVGIAGSGSGAGGRVDPQSLAAGTASITTRSNDATADVDWAIIMVMAIGTQ